MAGDARVSEAARKDSSFLGNRVDVESSRHRVAVLESHGLHARGAAGHSHAATTIQVQIPGGALFEPEVGEAESAKAGRQSQRNTLAESDVPNRNNRTKIRTSKTWPDQPPPCP